MENSRKSVRAGSSCWQVQRERGQISQYRPDPPRVEPKHIGDVVGGILDGLGCEEVNWVSDIAAQWNTIAGETVARHTRPGSVDFHCLTVFVDNSVWLNELSRYGQTQMLNNLRTQFGDDRITKLRLRLDPGSGH